MVGSGAKFVTVAVFNTKLLQFIVCPLGKTPLRYCEKSQELFSDSIGVAYPIVYGVPLLSPAHGRMLEIPQETFSPNFK